MSVSVSSAHRSLAIDRCRLPGWWVAPKSCKSGDIAARSATQRQLFVVARCAPGVRLATRFGAKRHRANQTRDSVVPQRPAGTRERYRRATERPLRRRAVGKLYLPAASNTIGKSDVYVPTDSATTKWRFSATATFQLRAPCRFPVCSESSEGRRAARASYADDSRPDCTLSRLSRIFIRYFHAGYTRARLAGIERHASRFAHHLSRYRLILLIGVVGRRSARHCR